MMQIIVLTTILLLLMMLLARPRKVEMIASILFVVLVPSVYFSIVYYQKMDTEILSGMVVKKYSERVPCSHSYQCHCRMVKTNGSYQQRCDTCYEHSYDVDWIVKSTVGSVIIDRVDRQGVKEPKRFGSVVIGEPFAIQHSYYNYLKGSTSSLFNNETIDKTIPSYPEKVHDYYKVNRIVNEKNAISNEKQQQFNQLIAEQLKTIGKTKQVNVVMVFTKNTQDYGVKIKNAWLNGRKNDVVVVVGSNDRETVDWCLVFGWSSKDALNIAIRNDINDHKTINEGIVNIIFDNIEKYWVRNEMKNFSYLDEENSVDIFTILCIMILDIIGMVTINHLINRHLEGRK